MFYASSRNKGYLNFIKYLRRILKMPKKINYSELIKEAYILSEGNIEIEGKRVYMPIYMIMFLENTELTNTIYKIDLDGLGE
jgi:hypothetical protein